MTAAVTTAITVTSEAAGNWSTISNWSLNYLLAQGGISFLEFRNGVKDKSLFNVLYKPAVALTSGPTNQSALDLGAVPPVVKHIGGYTFTVNITGKVAVVYNVVVQTAIIADQDGVELNSLSVTENGSLGGSSSVASIKCDTKLYNLGVVQLNSNFSMECVGNLYNQGFFYADGQLTADSTFFNQGHLIFQNSSYFSAPTIANAGGSIISENGAQQVLGSSVSGGTIDAYSASGITLQDSTVSGVAIIANGGNITLDGVLARNVHVTASNGGDVTLTYGALTKTVLQAVTGTVTVGNSGVLNGVELAGGGTFQGEDFEGYGNTDDSVLTNVTVDAGATYTAQQYDVTDLVGDIKNSGTLALAEAGYNSPAGEFLAAGPVQLTGGGTVSLSYGSYIGSTASTQGTLVNVDNTVEGANGAIGITVINEVGGTIDANAPYLGVLGLTFALDAAVTNDGTLEATSGGVLKLSGQTRNDGVIQASSNGTIWIAGDVQNTEENVAADSGGAIWINNGELDGGILAPTSTGTVTVGNSGVLNGVELAGGGTFQGEDFEGYGNTDDSVLTNVTVDAGATYTAQQYDVTDLVGDIKNSGTLALAEAGYNSPAGEFLAAGPVQLTGGGTVSLSYGSYIGSTASTQGTLVNVDNTVEGAGGFGVVVVNRASGLIAANAAGGGTTLDLSSGLQNQGTLLAAGGDTVQVDGGASNTGVFDASGGGTILITGNLENNGVITVGASSAANFQGSITGTGVLAVDSGVVTLTGSVSASETLKFLSDQGQVDLMQPGSSDQIISGFSPGDFIDLEQIASTKLTYAHNLLSIYSGTTLEAQLSFVGSYALGNFTHTSDGNGGTLISLHK
jgi:hypothetical protein